MPDFRYAEVIAAILAVRSWTIYRLAKEAGIPEQTVRAIAKGGAPRTDTLEKLLVAAGLDWKWFAKTIGPRPAE